MVSWVAVNHFFPVRIWVSEPRTHSSARPERRAVNPLVLGSNPSECAKALSAKWSGYRTLNPAMLGSSPTRVTKANRSGWFISRVAQRLERRARNPEVEGSSPSSAITRPITPTCSPTFQTSRRTPVTLQMYPGDHQLVRLFLRVSRRN